MLSEVGMLFLDRWVASPWVTTQRTAPDPRHMSNNNTPCVSTAKFCFRPQCFQNVNIPKVYTIKTLPIVANFRQLCKVIKPLANNNLDLTRSICHCKESNCWSSALWGVSAKDDWLKRRSNKFYGGKNRIDCKKIIKLLGFRLRKCF